MPNPPSPTTTADLWDLKASPATLAEVAGTWRSLQTAAVSAQDTVNGAALEVVNSEAWTGDAADSYDEHRRKLTGDVGEIGAWAGSVADALEAIAGVLTSAQNQLTDQWAALTATVPAIRGEGEVTFQPADAGQATAVTNAIDAANLVRAWVDEELVMKEAAFATTLTDIVMIKDTWRDQTVRLVNLNIGSGNDNLNLGDKPGVAPEEVDDLADRLVDQDADIATLQEVFEGDAERLERELEERTGDEWNLHYTEASEKPHITSPADLLTPADNMSQSFGNAVLVREGDLIAGSQTVDDHIDLDEESGPPPATPTPGTTTTSTTVPGTPVPPDLPTSDNEGRAGVHAEVEFRDG